ncbi:MAG: hypothetical protein A2W99_13325 [Bacteroidetes bacterium GWF2_33_16]|nr:MAG: hypothetical protein A2X00_00950 [Bacteroidetes bacterium GWE2_32_14]OFY06659.1 MAG: hypothetical protein A2W99_13325 [Bacteroidetes bacterium GWF2_33_16]
MRYICTKIVTLLLLLLVVNSVFAQDRFADLEKRLNELIPELPGLNEKIDISVNGTSIQEFIRGIANNSGVNINVDPSINVSIVNNFTNVKVIDVLLYLTKQYNLEITTIGNILTVKPFDAPKQVKPIQIDEILIKYDSKNDFLSYELVNDTLWKVLKEITRLSGKNVVAPAKLNSKIVNGYIQNMPFENVLEKLAITNDLVYEKTDDRFYVLSEKGIEAKQGSSGDNISGDKKKSDKDGIEAKNSVIKTFGTNSISIFAKDISIPWIIKRISDTLNVNYVIVDELEGKKDVNVQNIDYNNFLLRLLDGTKYSYNNINDIYIIGKSENLSILNTKLIKLQYRSVDKIVEHIPDEIKKGINVKEFPELNCIVVTGPQSRIDVVENFIRDIDKIVPVILIEVLIVDYNKNNSVVTGINAGIGTNPNPASQTILPGINYQFSTQSLNNLLGQFEGFGWFNLGKVTEDFYLSIKALETNGVIDIRSTPKLSTLNGHEANMSSGETKYYKEEKSNYIGTQNPSLANSYTWNPIKADLSLLIKPFVSGDEYITLEIEVSQSSFTPREFTDSPPGSVTRTFKSMIRMLDGEMILLGGIEKESSQNIGSGTPILSRIPIIKWFFSSKTKSNDKSRLNIFIKPTIIF